MVLFPTPARAATLSIVSGPYPTSPSSSRTASRMTRRERSMRGSRSVSTTHSFCRLARAHGNQVVEVEVELVVPLLAELGLGPAPREPQHRDARGEGQADRERGGDVERVGEGVRGTFGDPTPAGSGT